MTPPGPSGYANETRRDGMRRASPWPGWAPYLAEIPLFAGLSGRHLKSLARLADLRWYADGKTLVRAGSPGDAFFAIFKGRAELQTPAGHAHVLEADEFFGELALIDGAPRAATVVSAGGVSVARIERPAFLKLLREEPLIALGLARGVVAIIRDLQGDVGRSTVTAAGAPASVGEAAQPSEEPSQAQGDRGTERHTARRAVPLLASVPLFTELPQRHLRKVARVAELGRYPNGSVVARAGARGAVFHVIVAGRAQAVTPDGRATGLESGDCFGELSLLDGAPRSATVSAVDELVTLRITRADFMKLLKEESTIAVGLLRGLVALVRGLQRQEAG